MGLTKPYKRTIRQLKDGSYTNSGNSQYIKHPDYANSPEKYIRSFLLIQDDVQKLFEYVEPADKNKETYSYRIHELFIRVCIEVEANCKTILRENGYSIKKERWWNMSDYRLIEKIYKLSQYEIKLPRWSGKYGCYKPFSKWAENKELNWYRYYNGIKHDIHLNFRHANIKNLIKAMCGLVALLSSQFLNEDFFPNVGCLALEGSPDGMESAVGDYFRVKYPDLDEKDRYDFEWQKIKDNPDVIQCHNYNSMAQKPKNNT